MWNWFRQAVGLPPDYSDLAVDDNFWGLSSSANSQQNQMAKTNLELLSDGTTQMLDLNGALASQGLPIGSGMYRHIGPKEIAKFNEIGKQTATDALKGNGDVNFASKAIQQARQMPGSIAYGNHYTDAPSRFAPLTAEQQRTVQPIQQFRKPVAVDPASQMAEADYNQAFEYDNGFTDNQAAQAATNAQAIPAQPTPAQPVRVTTPKNNAELYRQSIQAGKDDKILKDQEDKLQAMQRNQAYINNTAMPKQQPTAKPAHNRGIDQYNIAVSYTAPDGSRRYFSRGANGKLKEVSLSREQQQEYETASQNTDRRQQQAQQRQQVAARTVWRSANPTQKVSDSVADWQIKQQELARQRQAANPVPRPGRLQKRNRYRKSYRDMKW